MTGIERLRRIARSQNMDNVWTAMLAHELCGIADQIERERACDSDTAENIRLIVGRVIDDMEHHILGHEGMGDSPVARWARELREALDGNGRDPAADVSMSAHDLLPEEEREAIAWVREHGGLDEVKRQRRDSVPRAAYELNLAKRQRQVDESHAALRRRNRWIAELEHLLCKEMSYSLRRDAGCLAPEVLDADGVEIREGDTLYYVDGREQKVNTVARLTDGLVQFGRINEAGYVTYCEGACISPDQLTHRAPVLAADGRPLREGETVYGIGQTQHRFVVRAASDYEEDEPDGRFCVPCIDKDDGDEECWCDPSQLTHERPVLDADGVLIKVGDTVYLLPGDWCDKFPLLHCHEWDAMKVLNLRPNHDTGRIECETSLGSVFCYPYPSQLTHQRPVIAADGKPLREGETVWDVWDMLGNFGRSDK